MSIRLFDQITHWLHELDQRQQQPMMHTVIIDEEHVCENCGTSYVGRFCPQCGLRGNFSRLTVKNVLQGFLDIWGFGSRPMLRSIQELFWRPGYMMRDYLHGHQPLYFPPFKMLVIMTLIFVICSSIRGIHPQPGDEFLYGDVFVRYGAAPWVISFFERIDKLILWLDNNPAYYVLFAGLFYIFASWLVFLRKMSFVEVFFCQIYISCQMQLVGAIWVLLAGYEAYYNIPPFAVPAGIALPLLCYDYAQLYGLGLWASLWRTVLTYALSLFFMISVGAIPIIIIKYF